MRFLPTKTLWILSFLLTSSLLRAADIPVENQAQGKEPPPGLDTFAEKVCAQLIATDKEKNDGLFFPRDPFIELKDIPQSGKYLDGLVEQFQRDWQKVLVRVGNSTRGWQCTGVKKGYCKWKPVGSEYNKIPYWSCYSSHITMTDNKGKKEDVLLRVVINWGKDWYITHMGK